MTTKRFEAMRPRFSQDWAIWDHANTPMCYAVEGYLNSDTKEYSDEGVVFFNSEEDAKYVADILNSLDGQRG